MKGDSKKARSKAETKPFSVSPGSHLYKVLELIAAEVAVELTKVQNATRGQTGDAKGRNVRGMPKGKR
jgi:hypothetical protein